MNQPLDFVAKDLDMMMPGGTPMITSGQGMYNTQGGNMQMGGGNMPMGGNYNTGYPNQPGNNGGFGNFQ